jgi:hypothetical protein
VAAYDEVIFQVVREAATDFEKRLNSDVMYFNSEIRMNSFSKSINPSRDVRRREAPWLSG